MSSLSSVNPATGVEIATYPIHDTTYREATLTRAAAAQKTWSGMSFQERGEGLLRIAEMLKIRKEELASLATAEMGKPIRQSREEIDKCVRCLEHYAKNGEAMAADEPVETEASKSYVAYRPMGVVLAIMPWNFPFWQVFRCLAPILMGGNAVVLKHASNVSGCALEIEKIVCGSSLPDGLFATLLVPGKSANELLQHPAVKAVTFTGSTAAGSEVASCAAKLIKKQVLELGGSDAYVILEDADMDLTVRTCVKARLVNNGQSCVAAKRFIVVASRLQEFEEKFSAAMEKTGVGDPAQEGDHIGPLARVDLRDELHKQVGISVANGAKILTGGRIPEGPGAFYPPTVLTNVTKGMPAFDEELFGPVAAIISARDEADALELANCSRYGLGGAIFSADTARAECLARDVMEAGSCFVNEAVHSHVLLPFGGVKESGYGRELGPFGMREFMVAKTVWIGK